MDSQTTGIRNICRDQYVLSVTSSIINFAHGLVRQEKPLHRVLVTLTSTNRNKAKRVWIPSVRRTSIDPSPQCLEASFKCPLLRTPAGSTLLDDSFFFRIACTSCRFQQRYFIKRRRKAVIYNSINDSSQHDFSARASLSHGADSSPFKMKKGEA